MPRPIDKKIVSDGWFTTQMPGPYQGNPFVANFLIQHAPRGDFGLDGWRIDTYILATLAFYNPLQKALSVMKYTADHPMFGEAWGAWNGQPGLFRGE